MRGLQLFVGKGGVQVREDDWTGGERGLLSKVWWVMFTLLVVLSLTILTKGLLCLNDGNVLGGLFSLTGLVFVTSGGNWLLRRITWVTKFVKVQKPNPNQGKPNLPKK